MQTLKDYKMKLNSMCFKNFPILSHDTSERGMFQV